MKKWALAAFVAGMFLLSSRQARAQQWAIPEISHTYATSSSGTLTFNSAIDYEAQNCLQHLTVTSSSGAAIVNIKAVPFGTLLYSIPIPSGTPYDSQWAEKSALCAPQGSGLSITILNGGQANTAVISAEEFVSMPNVMTGSNFLRLEDSQILLLEDGSHLLLN